MKLRTAITLLLGIFLYATPGAAVYKGGKVTDGGTIKGTLSFNGTPPALKTYTPTKDTEVCGVSLHTSDEVVIGADKRIRFVVVSLQDITQGMPLNKEAPAKLDQKGCRFIPHVTLVPRGGTLEIFNNDGILHNVRTTSKKNPSFNKAQPKFMKKIKHKFIAGPEKIKVNCDAHSWMNAWIVVQDHPYYAVTDERGAFALENVPAGTYTIEFWHGQLGVKTTTVTVKANETINVDSMFE